MKKIYILGDRSSKSLSPLIFNHWFKKYKIKAKYDFIEVKKRNFNQVALNTLREKDVIGLNITIPYKIKIIRLLKKLDPHAKKINANAW